MKNVIVTNCKILLVISFFFVLNISAASNKKTAALGYVGKVFPSEKTTWVDEEYSHEITKWTSDKYRSWPLYFNVESFIDDNNVIIYSNRSGAVNLFRLNFIDGTMTQMTNEAEDISGETWYI